MSAISVLAFYPWTFVSLVGLIGLLVGSFLNVVIYRLPVMMQRDAESQARAYLGLDLGPRDKVFNLAFPRSCCPSCSHQIRSWENIPMLSWAMLRGRCSSCKAPISGRYPIIELATCVMSTFVAMRFGYRIDCFYALVLVWACIALFMIDVDHMLLPDAIVIPWIWIGLSAGYLEIFTSIQSSFVGAIAGYFLFAIPAWIYAMMTGREAMGVGDFKLMSLFGAWLGWQMLPLIFLISSIAAAIAGLVIARKGSVPFAFGPFIIIAAMVALFSGHDLYAWYFRINGLHMTANFFG